MVTWRKVAGKHGAALREGASLDTAELGTIPTGARCCVEEETTLEDSGKVRCRLSAPIAGWVSKKLLSARPVAPPPARAPPR